ncbi:hypothetical protein SAMN05518865_11754 [Duganella sp. CF458]|uniref:hypothetical protein n=1 Tax=Duganella sp. CF458 TaxID=1884368 RepID=UPI0008E3741F|nr:hypothetical protein [Duganella sp. CF458]SFG73411.1 hypothetical protein SAMN05518865_11754 [Duganella sp. CF458]
MDAATKQTIFLLERYTSPEYFARLLETWENFVALNEASVTKLSSNLPLDLRQRPLPEQGDIVWNSIVLPNYRRTLEALRDAHHRIELGDLTALATANKVMNDFKGEQDYSNEWMTPEDQDNYSNLLSTAVQYASNIVATEDANWKAGSLSTDYYASGRGPLDLPNRMPRYRISSKISTASGEPLSIAGIYMPDVEHSMPQFLSTRKEIAPSASILVGYKNEVDEDGAVTGQKRILKKSACIWSLVELVADATAEELPPISSDLERVPALERCPRSGDYFSPAKPDSRRYFEAGDLMPDLGSTYGRTIWQWVQDQ